MSAARHQLGELALAILNRRSGVNLRHLIRRNPPRLVSRETTIVRQRRGEDWSIARDYVRSRLQRVAFTENAINEYLKAEPGPD